MCCVCTRVYRVSLCVCVRVLCVYTRVYRVSLCIPGCSQLHLLSAEFQTFADVPRLVCSCVQRFFVSMFSLLSEIQNALDKRLCWGMVFGFENCTSFFKKDILNA